MGKLTTENLKLRNWLSRQIQMCNYLSLDILWTMYQAFGHFSPKTLAFCLLTVTQAQRLPAQQFRLVDDLYIIIVTAVMSENWDLVIRMFSSNFHL